MADGRFADLAVMAITRPEWAVLRKRAEWAAKQDALSPLQRKLREKSLRELAQRRQNLFAPLGPDVAIETDAGFIFSPLGRDGGCSTRNPIARMKQHGMAATAAARPA